MGYVVRVEVLDTFEYLCEHVRSVVLGVALGKLVYNALEELSPRKQLQH